MALFHARTLPEKYMWVCGCTLETKVSDRIFVVAVILCISSDGWSLWFVSVFFFIWLNLSFFFVTTDIITTCNAKKKNRVNLGIHRKIVTISRFIHANTQSYYIMCKYNANARIYFKSVRTHSIALHHRHHAYVKKMSAFFCVSSTISSAIFNFHPFLRFFLFDFSFCIDCSLDRKCELDAQILRRT